MVGISYHVKATEIYGGKLTYPFWKVVSTRQKLWTDTSQNVIEQTFCVVWKRYERARPYKDVCFWVKCQLIDKSSLVMWDLCAKGRQITVTGCPKIKIQIKTSKKIYEPLSFSRTIKSGRADAAKVSGRTAGKKRMRGRKKGKRSDDRLFFTFPSPDSWCYFPFSSDTQQIQSKASLDGPSEAP